MTENAILVLCAAHSFGFALFHLLFWRLFDWPASLRTAGTANRAILPIANACLIYLFSAVGAVCLMFPQALLHSELGRALLAGMAGFWCLRLLLQFAYLRRRHPLVQGLNVAFVLGAGLFAWPLFALAPLA
ncbi:MAG: hypothetical protein KDJ14_05325 [Xanthomonadales bacterium]|nr:hypothetical protein [Xanthomonadales bacterium]